MSIDVATFRARFPEFAEDTEFPDPRVQLFIDDSVNIHLGTNEARWGGKYEYAQSYLVAHHLALATNTELGDSSASIGPISSKSAGGVSVTHAVIAKDRSSADEALSSTSYGLEFLATRNRCFIGVMVANCL